MLVKNNYFANEDNDHEGKQNKTNIKKWKLLKFRM